MPFCPRVWVPNASLRESGDQRGRKSRSPLVLVTGTGFVPSASATQIWSSPLRSETNAIRLPSGEYDGLESRPADRMSERWAAGSFTSERQIDDPPGFWQ